MISSIIDNDSGTIPKLPDTYYEVLSEIKAELEDKYRLHDIEEIYSNYGNRIVHVWFLKVEEDYVKVAFLKTWYDKYNKQWVCTWKVLGDNDESNV